MRGIRSFLHRFRYPERYAFLETLLENRNAGPEQAEARQQDALADILRHAARAVPYYRDRLKDIAAPAGVDLSIADWPVLTRETVRAHRERLVRDGFDRDRLRALQTGGSTGEPLAFYYDAGKHELMRAGMMRSYMACGWRPGDKIVNFWGARQDLKARTPARRAAEWMAAERTLPAWTFGEPELRDWVRTLVRERPVVVQGYASVLAEIARFALAGGWSLPSGVKGVYSTAEILYDPQRMAIEAAFGCPVFNQYGSREVPNIACECAHGRMHVFTDMVYLESVGADNQLYVTSLTNRVFPFIRYRNGDSGRLGPAGCACGSPFPVLEMGVCRSNDVVKTSAGRRIYPSWFVHLLDAAPGVRQFRFVQAAPDRMRLELVGTPVPAATLAVWQARIRAEVDPAMRLEAVYCDAIPRSASGKHRFVIAR